MFRIRRIYDDALPVDHDAILQVQELLISAIPELDPREAEAIPGRLREPFPLRFLTRLYVAERQPGRVLGFALVLQEPELRFFFLDSIASAGGGGVGGAVYQRVREEAVAQGARGIFFESLPDDPALCRRPEKLADNASRLRFYETFGARPIVGTGYETPVSAADDCPPFLVFDGLGSGEPLRRDFARRVVRAVLERKYADICPPEYVERVVASFRDDPVRLRDPRYGKTAPRRQKASSAPGPIRLVVSDRHDIHHVRERGYVESPVRVASILAQIEADGLCERIEPRSHSEKWIRAVHDPGLVDYLRRACAGVPEGKAVYPYVFPVRNAARPPRDLSVRAGYWCIDTFTPISRNAWPAARRAVDCTLTAADEVLSGRRFAYALVRPPGHHAERRLFGGFCYLGNAAIAANYMGASVQGRVAILDVDYHHGNGQQDIFYERDDVLTVSIHGHPSFAYPYFSGFEDERGAGPGEGYNLNLPLPESVDGARYRKELDKALRAIEAFRPLLLVVALGLDPAKGDPTGTWSLTARDFEENGRAIGALRLPTLIVQEGGYRTRTLGTNARRFFEGFLAGGA